MLAACQESPPPSSTVTRMQQRAKEAAAAAAGSKALSLLLVSHTIRSPFNERRSLSGHEALDIRGELCSKMEGLAYLQSPLPRSEGGQDCYQASAMLRDKK